MQAWIDGECTKEQSLIEKLTAIMSSVTEIGKIKGNRGQIIEMRDSKENPLPAVMHSMHSN